MTKASDITTPPDQEGAEELAKAFEHISFGPPSQDAIEKLLQNAEKAERSSEQQTILAIELQPITTVTTGASLYPQPTPVPTKVIKADDSPATNCLQSTPAANTGALLYPQPTTVPQSSTKPVTTTIPANKRGTKRRNSDMNTETPEDAQRYRKTLKPRHAPLETPHAVLARQNTLQEKSCKTK
jgi:hypothetical protein